jgi:hypothetical protein
MLKKAIWPPLPDGRGSVSACKHVAAFLSGARQGEREKNGWQAKAPNAT